MSVVSDSVRPHRWQPTRLPCPWDSPGKNWSGCHFLLQCMKANSEREVASSIHRDNLISISFVSQKGENEVEIVDEKIVENTIEHINAT